MNGVLIKCLMCYGPTEEAQKLTAGRKPRRDCPMCWGGGILFATFEKGLEENEVQMKDETNAEGVPIVVLDISYNPNLH